MPGDGEPRRLQTGRRPKSNAFLSHCLYRPDAVRRHAAQAKVDITVDKNNQQMTVAVDGVARYHWPVSTGIPSRETPSGTFRAFRMEEDHYSKEFDDAPMPHSIFFTKVGHAIHGTDSEGRLGTPASHGCVRLSRDNASTLYALVRAAGRAQHHGDADRLGRRSRWRATRAGRHRRRAPRPRASREQQYASAGDPVVLTPQPQRTRPQFVQQDDSYIYPADGSSDPARYPAPPSRRAYDAQVYGSQVYGSQVYGQQQQQYYANRGYAPAPQGYYRPQPQP